MDINNSYVFSKEIRELQNETNFISYCLRISEMQDVSILIAVKDIIGRYLGEDGLIALRKIGCGRITINPNPDWRPYIAIIEQGRVTFEEIGNMDDSLHKKTSIQGKQIDVFSSPFHTGNTASIIIDNIEYAANLRGFNIVIINRMGEIIDSVAFDTHSEDRICNRKLNEIKSIVVGRPCDYLMNRETGSIRKRMQLNNILGIDCIPAIEKKIKIRFFVWGASDFWNSVHSVIQEFSNDEAFDSMVVLQSKNTSNVQSVCKIGVKFVFFDDYRIEDDKPDIAYFNKARSFYLDYSSLKYKVNVEAGLINGYERNNDVDAIVKDICDKDVDAILVEKHIFELIENAGANKDGKWIAFGNPKFDIIYQGKKLVNDLPKGWKKIENKTVIVWTCDHNWYLNDFTFDLYIRYFLEYFRNNNDIALVIRPHKMVEYEMKKTGIWNDQDAEILKSYVRNSSNIIWDDLPDYSLALNVADGLITDINCGISLSGMVINKPIGITHRYDGYDCDAQYSEINECHYQIYNQYDLYEFFDMVLNKKDPLKDKRNKIKDKYICHFDGENGSRIKDYIVQQYKYKMHLEN